MKAAQVMEGRSLVVLVAVLVMLILAQYLLLTVSRRSFDINQRTADKHKSRSSERTHDESLTISPSSQAMMH